MPKLQELATKRIRPDGQARICNLRTPAAIRVLAATARLWEIQFRSKRDNRGATQFFRKG